MIVRAFWGAHIDLSKIVQVSDVYFSNRMGRGGYYCGFTIHCQLVDKPITIEYEVRELDVLCFVQGGDTFDIRERDPDIVESEAVPRLQAKVDEFIELWKETSA
jgi:hypothetical protein